MNNIDVCDWFTDEERQLMKHLLALWREGEAGIMTEDEAGFAMDDAGNDFEGVHGEGSVRSIFGRIKQAIALNRERSAIVPRLASRVLGGQSGDLACWLNAADVAFLKQIGVTL
jgi:hypothetical protein